MWYGELGKFRKRGVKASEKYGYWRTSFMGYLQVLCNSVGDGKLSGPRITVKINVSHYEIAT